MNTMMPYEGEKMKLYRELQAVYIKLQIACAQRDLLLGASRYALSKIECAGGPAAGREQLTAAIAAVEGKGEK